MKGSKFVLGYVQMFKTNTNRGGSYIDSPDWKKKATTSLLNIKDNRCFQYAVTVVLNHEEIKSDPQRITKIKPFY